MIATSTTTSDTIASEVNPNPRVLRCMKRSIVVNMGCVRYLQGWSLERALEAVDRGEFLWVWDITAGTKEFRTLRFWTREIIAPETCLMLRPEVVISHILGAKDFWNVATIADLLNCTRQHVHDLFDTKSLHGVEQDSALGAKRESLVKFLADRLVSQT